MSTFANQTEWESSTDDDKAEYYVSVGKSHLEKLEAYTPTSDDNISELNLLKQQFQTTLARVKMKDLRYNKGLSNDVKQFLAQPDGTQESKALYTDILVIRLEQKLKRFDEVLESSKNEGDNQHKLLNLRDFYKAQLGCLHDLKADLQLTAIGGSRKRARSWETGF